GVILGAVLLATLPELFRYTIVPAQQAMFGKQLVDPEVLRMMLFGLALVGMMLFRPSGIWPSQVRKRELGG
ncbi:MAG TPA: ABC transporter ATP-binding protein, partial [Burkholderiales bacterium]|nr:ABC transporter ATP-binding protein [Burkholderiales bacterium]